MPTPSIIQSMNLSFHLLQLQKIDTQIDQIKIRLGEIAKILSNNSKIKQAEADLAESKSRMHAAKMILQNLEAAANEKKVKIEHSEAALYGGKIHNPKELQDLQNEIASLKRTLAALEDDQLEAMLSFEQSEFALRDSQKALDEVHALVITEQAGLTGERTKLDKNLDTLHVERNAVLGQIPAEVVEMYQKLRLQKRGVAVSTVSDQTCTTCGTTLTPADWQAARSPQKIVFCSSCGRILYAG
jgi:predicted  nucleic acid-binding Zn-ribbon protein